MSTVEDLVGKVVGFIYNDKRYSSERITPIQYMGVLIGEDDTHIALNHTLEEALGSRDYTWYYRGRMNFNKQEISTLNIMIDSPEEHISMTLRDESVHFYVPLSEIKSTLQL